VATGVGVVHQTTVRVVSLTVVAAASAVLVAAGALRLGSPANALLDSPRTIVGAGMLVLIVPGLIWGQVAGVRAVHVIDAVAKAAAGSFGLALTLALIAFTWRWTITAWAALLLILVVAGLLAMVLPSGRGRAGLVTDMVRHSHRRPWSTAALGTGILLMSSGMYRWADSPESVGWEVGIQLSYVRQYASGLVLDPRLTALRPDASLALPNVFFLWEFLLAGVSRLSAVDPLIAALRCRWTIPGLGLPAFFTMLVMVTRSVRIAERAFGVTLLVIMSGFMFLAPSPLAVLGPFGSTRGLTAFWGSIHHSDAAMEILLPLQIAALFSFLARGGRHRLAALVLLLVLSFFWHPREYFQVMWYGALAVLVIVMAGRGPSARRGVGRRSIALFAAFIVIAAALAFSTSSLVSRNETVRDQLAAKGALARRLLEQDVALGAYPPFNAPLFGYGAPLPAEPYVYSWMALASVLMLPLAIAGSPALRWLVLFYAILWATTICWFWPQVLLLVATYSEILVSSMRFLNLFAVAIIGSGWVVVLGIFQLLFAKLFDKRLIGVAILAASGALGLGFRWAWRSQQPHFSLLGPVLSLTAAMAAVIALLLLRRSPERMRRRPARVPSLAMTMCSGALLLAPMWATDFARDLVTTRTQPAAFFSGANPLGLSPQLIRFLRARVPAREVIAVDPGSVHLLGVYAPVYVRPYPVGYILADLAEIRQSREDRHPLFNAAAREGSIRFAEAEEYVARTEARWILFSTPYDRAGTSLADARPELFKVAFRSPTGELLLHVEATPPRRR